MSTYPGKGHCSIFVIIKPKSRLTLLPDISEYFRNNVCLSIFPFTRYGIDSSEIT